MTEHRMPSRRSHLPDLEPPSEEAEKVQGVSAVVIVASAACVAGFLLGVQIMNLFTAHNEALIEFRAKVEEMSK